MCDRPCESGGSVVQAEDGSTTAVLGVLESVQPLRKAGSVGMQRTGLMHVGWWGGVLSVLANIKADYLRRPPSERRQPEEIWLKNHHLTIGYVSDAFVWDGRRSCLGRRSRGWVCH